MNHNLDLINNIECQIKFYKNQLRTLNSVLYLNIIASLLQAYCLYNNPTHIFNATLFGATIINVVWLYSNIWFLKNDFIVEKNRLSHIKNIYEIDIIEK